MHVRPFYLLVFLVLQSCGYHGNEIAIRTEREILDVQLSQRDPDKRLSNETTAQIGFDQEGFESRLIIYVPKLRELWESKVIFGSIGKINLNIPCLEVPVNPENILLQPVSRDWSPMATWSSFDSLFPNQKWSEEGGDTYESSLAVSPAIRRYPSEPSLYELSFNITESVKSMIVNNQPNYGYLIRIRQSPLNSEDSVHLVTFNNRNPNVRPTASLTFSTEEVFAK